MIHHTLELCRSKKNRGGKTMGLCNIQHLNEISQQKVKIINLNRVLMIICKGTNGQTDKYLPQYSGISSHSKGARIIFSFSLSILIKPFDGNLGQPLPERLLGVGYACPTKPCRWRGKRLHHGGELVCLCFASQKPSEREFFVRAQTDLGVKLLISYFPKEYFSYIIVCRIRQYQ